jgi:hypothetical protein
MDVLIKDFNIQLEPIIAKRVHISVENVLLNTRVRVRVVIYSTDNIGDSSYIDTKFIDIEGDEYKNWGSDDQYLIDLVLKKLGIERLQETIVPIEETVVPVEETVVPVEETVVPVEETVVPVEETVVPVEETVV